MTLYFTRAAYDIVYLLFMFSMFPLTLPLFAKGNTDLGMIWLPLGVLAISGPLSMYTIYAFGRETPSKKLIGIARFIGGIGAFVLPMIILYMGTTGGPSLLPVTWALEGLFALNPVTAVVMVIIK